MSSLSNVYVKLETLETLLAVVKKKGEKGISIDISISETTNEWGQNLTAYVSQTKEQRDEKKPRFYVGNGKCFWTDGKIEIAKKKEAPEAKPATTTSEEEPDDLPF
jgi:hypothetical protein